jgi:hypothetical protein
MKKNFILEIATAGYAGLATTKSDRHVTCGASRRLRRIATSSRSRVMARDDNVISEY